MTKRNLSLFLGAILSMTTMLRADIHTYGSDPTQNLGTLDTCVGCLFALIQFPGSAAGQQVLSYQFYNGAGASANYLTPILLEQNSNPADARSFTILAIGDSSTGFVAGYNSINFVLASGTNDVVDGNTFFGYIDGSVNGAGGVSGNTGTITSNYPTGPGTPGYFAGYSGSADTYPVPLITAGTPISTSEWADVGQNNRNYSLQVTTTPEPGLYGVLALGLSGVVVALTRRRRRA